MDAVNQLHEALKAHVIGVEIVMVLKHLLGLL